MGYCSQTPSRIRKMRSDDAFDWGLRLSGLLRPAGGAQQSVSQVHSESDSWQLPGRASKSYTRRGPQAGLVQLQGQAVWSGPPAGCSDTAGGLAAPLPGRAAH